MKKGEEKMGKPLNFLRKERVVVRYLPKLNGIWGNNPKHILNGGMAETAIRTFVVPRTSSGMFVAFLEEDEKQFLEETLGLEYGAMSFYKKNNNFWSDSNEEGINKVKLHKQDNYLDLSNPTDYIKYKILLANSNYIAPSLEVLQDKPKATYQFVIISEGEETLKARQNMSTTMECYKEFGKIEEDSYTLRVILETLTSKVTASNSKIEFLQTEINKCIQADSKTFLKVIKDPLLKTKVLIKKCVENNIISKRGDQYYLAKENKPLCKDNEDPTLSVAANYLNSPKNQDLLFLLQEKCK